METYLHLMKGGAGNLAAYLAAHVLLCLLPAFFIAGAMAALIPKASITRWLGRNAPYRVSYPAAVAAGSLLALVLLVVETTDLIFAVDSIPAIFAVTQKPFIVFTSNVFAILGLRSLYFVLAGAIDYFRYLKVGLSFVLVFIGGKMLLDPHDQPPTWFQVDIPSSVSLLVVGAIIATSIAVSVVAARHEKRAGRKH